ncbi:DUF6046 domain-containing protein [Chitinophaga sp. HK235]|uniref:DUF6046 domain-containing protein n=1 Tax=Chitinophaga sp. HK235 TaxID=2952571 RepID=UPI001BABCA81|nr:DUF6046 domain-containing protein [Chitinophaga sp. HK235]
MAKFDLAKLYNEAFNRNPGKDFDIKEAVGQTGLTKLGKPYSFTDDQKRGHFSPVKLNDYVLPFATVEVTCKRTYTATPMPERNGSVKEVTGRDDYIINIKGIDISDEEGGPTEAMSKIEAFFLSKEKITIDNIITNIFLKGRPYAMITDMKFSREKSTENARPYEISLLSDDIYTLEFIGNVHS